jgi:hypothetical protein
VLPQSKSVYSMSAHSLCSNRSDKQSVRYVIYITSVLLHSWSRFNHAFGRNRRKFCGRLVVNCLDKFEQAMARRIQVTPIFHNVAHRATACVLCEFVLPAYRTYWLPISA